MFGLCMPRGETYLIMKDGSLNSIMLSDEPQPRKFIMTDKHILSVIKHYGYENIDKIVYSTDYKHNGKKTIVSMAEYYAKNGKELEV